MRSHRPLRRPKGRGKALLRSPKNNLTGTARGQKRQLSSLEMDQSLTPEMYHHQDEALLSRLAPAVPTLAPSALNPDFRGLLDFFFFNSFQLQNFPIRYLSKESLLSNKESTLKYLKYKTIVDFLFGKT